MLFGKSLQMYNSEEKEKKSLQVYITPLPVMNKLSLILITNFETLMLVISMLPRKEKQFIILIPLHSFLQANKVYLFISQI